VIKIYSPSFAFTLMFFYKGDYPFGHKLAQLGELPVTPLDWPRLILGVLQYGIRTYGLAYCSCKFEHRM
jgi:hypothetical protein